MDRVNEIVGHLTDEEYDAVLYSVMLGFLERKAKEKKLPFDDLYLQIDNKSKTIDLYFVDSKDSQPLFLDETNINEVQRLCCNRANYCKTN